MCLLPFFLSIFYFSIIITTATAVLACINYKPNGNTLNVCVCVYVFHSMHVSGGESRMSRISNFIFFDVNNLLDSVKCVRCTLYAFYLFLLHSNSPTIFNISLCVLLWVCQLFQLRSQLLRFCVIYINVINAKRNATMAI